ncbi:MAG: hypothetical protein H6737_18250 [Alphaproteobacteria bacterium]|nr:hypothetical protein [Alphaproteobacteria bacterium]
MAFETLSHNPLADFAFPLDGATLQTSTDEPGTVFATLTADPDTLEEVVDAFDVAMRDRGWETMTSLRLGPSVRLMYSGPTGTARIRVTHGPDGLSATIVIEGVT